VLAYVLFWWGNDTEGERVREERRRGVEVGYGW